MAPALAPSSHPMAAAVMAATTAPATPLKANPAEARDVLGGLAIASPLFEARKPPAAPTAHPSTAQAYVAGVRWVTSACSQKGQDRSEGMDISKVVSYTQRQKSPCADTQGLETLGW